ncbi:hypothetical protein PI124_g18258 [Phytophthora idaei]|nr:hypothetical protein PI125_g19399 [Phytophthora idaei]KAG3136009.1 hypothetical protein PI126_g18004 [Phytophthora idaei]KAG3236736.1 hypothetical protein PI124_g18258 [Phytophthora idaei]
MKTGKVKLSRSLALDEREVDRVYAEAPRDGPTEYIMWKNVDDETLIEVRDAGTNDVDATANANEPDDSHMEVVQDQAPEAAALPTPNAVSALPSTEYSVPLPLPTHEPARSEDIIDFHHTEYRRVSDQYTTSIAPYSESNKQCCWYNSGVRWRQ